MDNPGPAAAASPAEIIASMAIREQERQELQDALDVPANTLALFQMSIKRIPRDVLQRPPGELQCLKRYILWGVQFSSLQSLLEAAEADGATKGELKVYQVALEALEDDRDRRNEAWVEAQIFGEVG